MDFVDFFFNSLQQVFASAEKSAWLVWPIALGVIAWRLWLYYINLLFLRSIKWQLLEVQLPREIRRSPLAMELVLNALHQTGGTGTWFDKYWKGQLRFYFSLEIVSIEGAVHFLIRTPDRFRNFIESYIYAQYPEAEIREVPDYVDRLEYATGGRWSMWGTEFVLTKPDPYPIKTYVDYGVDKIAKEEEKIDPITSTIELMGSMQKGEQMWLQILVRALNKDGKTWKKQVDEEIKKFKEDIIKKAGGDEEGFQETRLTKGERDVITAIERHSEKVTFDIGIRAIYIAEKESFRPANIPSVVNMLKQYNSNTLNGFKPARATAVDFPWQEYVGFDKFIPYINLGLKETEQMKIKLFNLYLKRDYFYGANRRDPFALTTEELATIYHFPGRVAQTPSFGRVDSKKAEPPSNLPM
ncbi:hypothetical protein KW797_03910 [Candidatus Parcubacteria bacterium]|nr:hypothetical protein [Candidatus Parcubacteria bacterium]